MNDSVAAAGARTPALPLAVAADLIQLETGAGRVALYHASPQHPVAGLPPLLLVHSVNAAASAAEARSVCRVIGSGVVCAEGAV